MNRIVEVGQNAYSHARRAIGGGQREGAPDPSAQLTNNGDENRSQRPAENRDENLSQEVLLQQSQLDISTINRSEEPTNLSARSRDVLGERTEPSSISGRQILEPISRETQESFDVQSENSSRTCEGDLARAESRVDEELYEQRELPPMSGRSHRSTSRSVKGIEKGSSTFS